MTKLKHLFQIQKKDESSNQTVLKRKLTGENSFWKVTLQSHHKKRGGGRKIYKHCDKTEIQGKELKINPIYILQFDLNH